MRPVLLLSFALMTLEACSKGGEGLDVRSPQGEGIPRAGVELSDDAFAGAVHDLLLSEPRSSERSVRLRNVVAKQLERAADLYRAKEQERGLLAATGGLYLVRLNEFVPQMVTPKSVMALEDAAREVALIGDEGRSLAFYNLLRRVLPDPQRGETEQHLDALARWSNDTYGAPGTVVRAGALERAAVRRRLFEPSAEAHSEAVASLKDWIALALNLRRTFRNHKISPTREEAGEAFRALQTGATALLAVYLIDGDAPGALAAVEAAHVRELLPPDAIRALEKLASKPDAAGYLEMLQAMRVRSEPEEEQEEGDVTRDQEFFRAVAFRVALEAYRLDPTVPEAAGVVAAGLQRYGMGEACPTVLVEAVKAHPEPRIVSSALAIVMQAMAFEVEEENPDSARRVYQAAAPLLELADSSALAGRLQPSSSRVRSLMGEIELGEGRIAKAKELFASAVQLEPSSVVLLGLARIENHLGNLAESLDHVRKADHEAERERNLPLRGEALVLLSDLLLAQGDAEGAREALVTALGLLAQGQRGPTPVDRIGAERELARVLDRMGEPVLAQHALDRALSAATHDKKQLTVILSQQISRALVRSDVAVARDSLHRAIAAEIDDGDLTYFALWVWLLERQLKTPTDGTAARVFTSVTTESRWETKLAAFGAGKLSAKELAAAASTVIEQSEALFYQAMDRRALGDVQGAQQDLKQFLEGPGLYLVETVIAREIAGPPKQSLGPLPAGFTFR